MNSLEEVIQKLYKNLIGIISNGFSDSELKIVAEEYMGILQNRYSDLPIVVSDYDELYEKIFKLEYNEWNDLAIDVKKHILLKDNALNEIISIASEAFGYANERLNKNTSISAELANKYIDKLQALMENVSEYNKALAQWHISEGILDLKYASGQTNNTSLRIGHMR